MTAAVTPAIEQRRRRGERRAYRLKSLLTPLLGLLLSAAAVLGLGLAVERSADAGEAVGVGEVLARLVGGGEAPMTYALGAAAAAWLGTWVVLLGVLLTRLLLRGPFITVAIVRVTIDEALRTKVAGFVALLLIVTLAALPLTFTDDQPLRYQLQSYLTYATFGASVLLTLLTCLYACYSTARDLEEQRAHELFTKPVPRLTYLVGKWLGVTLLNVVLVVASGLMIGYVARVVLGGDARIEQRAAVDRYDASAVDDQVLVARGTAEPRPPVDFTEVARERLQLRARDNEELFSQELARAGSEATLLREETQALRRAWLSIPPGDLREYRFQGLGNVKASGQQAVQLRYRPKLPSLDRGTGILLTLAVQGEIATLRSTVDQVQVYGIDSSFIGDDGTLTIGLANGDLASRTAGTRAVSFDEGDLQILYKVGGFGPNLARAMALLLVRLGFLAMLGVACGALLSMPVAITLTLFGALIATFAASLASVVGGGTGPTGIAAVDTLYGLLLWAVLALTRVLSTYGEVGLATLLSDGRWVRGADVLWTLLVVGVGWVGIALAVGWFFLWRREIARVQV